MRDEIVIPSGVNSTLGKVISEEEIFKELLKDAIVRKFKKGHIIIDVGDKIQSLHYLKEGSIRVIAENYNNKSILHRICSQTTFGESIFLHEIPSNACFVALEECLVYLFPKNVILSYLEKQDDFIKLLIRTLTSKMTINVTKIESIINIDSKAKIARILYLIASSNGNPKKVINISQDDIASMVGVHRVTVTRSIDKLKKEGVISTSRNSIVIKDMEKLKYAKEN